MSKKTDNSFLGDKVALRLKSLPAKETIRVLDCFHGKGTIWREVSKKTNKKIEVCPIDIKTSLDEICLIGDNRAWLQSLNLNDYDVVDLDAYGVPYEQIKVLLERKYKGIVFVTFIQSVLGGLPHKMLLEIGFTKDIIDKGGALCYKNGLQHFLSYLAKQKIKKIKIRSYGKTKHYLCFNCADIGATN